MRTAAATLAGASIRAFASSVGLATMLGKAAPGVSAELKDPLSPLTSAGGSILCFGRDYSPDHLARHPKQMTKSVLLAFQQGFADVVLTSRRGTSKRIGAGCGWRKGAGIDTSDRKMIPNFNKAAGFDCLVTVGGSAEERGYFLIDPGLDAKSLNLFLLSPIGRKASWARPKATVWTLALRTEPSRWPGSIRRPASRSKRL